MSGSAEPEEIQRPSAHTLGAFATAVGRVADDPDFLVAALTDRLTGAEPIAKRATVVAAERLEAVKGGLVTADEVVALVDLVLRNSLRIADVLRWTIELTRTRSLTETAALLRWSQAQVVEAVEDRRLVAVEINTLWRFPDWQFTYGTPDRLLPGLPNLATVMKREQWELAGAFLRTPQATFGGWVDRSPRDWLLAGCDVQAVVDALGSYGDHEVDTESEHG